MLCYLPDDFVSHGTCSNTSVVRRDTRSANTTITKTYQQSSLMGNPSGQKLSTGNFALPKEKKSVSTTMSMDLTPSVLTPMEQGRTFVHSVAPKPIIVSPGFVSPAPSPIQIDAFFSLTAPKPLLLQFPFILSLPSSYLFHLIPIIPNLMTQHDSFFGPVTFRFHM